MEALTIRLQNPTPPDADALIRRLYERLRKEAPRRERGQGEALQAGDEIECDTLTVMNGRVLAGSSQRGARLELRPFLYLPGFYEGLLKIPVFSAETVSVKLPDDYPVADCAGGEASIYVEVRRAWAVEMPELDDASALEAAGLGSELDEAMQMMAQEIDVEQGEELMLNATQGVLDQIAQQTEVPDLEKVVDHELKRYWVESDGAFLVEKDFPESFRSQAQADFVSDPGMRAQMRRRIRVHVGLGALIEKEKLVPSPNCVQTLLELAGEATGLTPAQVKQELDQDRGAAHDLLFTGIYLTALEHALARARFEID